jgi:tetratricopeptide (TPR) repeat protein
MLYLILGDGLEKHRLDAEALKLYQSALKYPSTATSKMYTRVARIQGQRGRIPEAIAAFQKAVELDPNDTETLNKLAVTFLLAGGYRGPRAWSAVVPRSTKCRGSQQLLMALAERICHCQGTLREGLEAELKFLEPHKPGNALNSPATSRMLGTT